MPRLLLDQDGPLAAFDPHYWVRCRAQGWTFDIDNEAEQTKRYFSDHITDRGERQLSREMTDGPGWFADLPVVEGAQEGVEQLLREGWEIDIVTKPLQSNAYCADEKRAWIAKHFPMLKDRVYVVPDKSRITGDVLLDDSPKPKWFAQAQWYPVIFSRPHNSAPGSELANLPHFTWGDDTILLMEAAHGLGGAMKLNSVMGRPRVEGSDEEDVSDS